MEEGPLAACPIGKFERCPREIAHRVIVVDRWAVHAHHPYLVGHGVESLAQASNFSFSLGMGHQQVLVDAGLPAKRLTPRPNPLGRLSVAKRDGAHFWRQ